MASKRTIEIDIVVVVNNSFSNSSEGYVHGVSTLLLSSIKGIEEHKSNTSLWTLDVTENLITVYSYGRRLIARPKLHNEEKTVLDAWQAYLKE